MSFFQFNAQHFVYHAVHLHHTKVFGHPLQETTSRDDPED